MYSLWVLITYYVRSIKKWFLRKATGLCELQRICYGEIPGACRTRAVETSLHLSRSPQIRELITNLNHLCTKKQFREANSQAVKYALSTVLSVKKIQPKVHLQFTKSFTVCVQHIWGYRQLLDEVEQLRTTVYDASNVEHEQKLYKLWQNLVPNEALELRITKQWQTIGFQGDDPKTDFRGMGLLGLENLLFFATEYRAAAIHVLSHSQHPVYGYTFAIVGINLTSMACQLLKEGAAKTYFYNISKDFPTLRHFHKFYCYLFYKFDLYWVQCKPKNIMEFSAIKEKFEQNIRFQLQDPTSLFKMNLSVDIV